MEKPAKYEALIKQLIPLLSGEKDAIANAANVCALLQSYFSFWWTGFYFVQGQTLVLGPFQGPVACTRIAKGRGVCGQSWQTQRAIVVPDVHAFEGHIACSEFSKSEIVLPVFAKSGEVLGVLDIDSQFEAFFDEQDEKYLTEIVKIYAESCEESKG